MAAAPDGHAIYVTGTTGAGYGTIAYDATTGDQLWAASYSNGSQAVALVVGPSGDVYVTGTAIAATSAYGTVAYQG